MTRVGLWAGWLLVLLYGALAADQYSIDWTNVELGATSPAFDLDTDIGPCICNVTFNDCDVNCQCDTDCSTTEKTRFSGSLPEGPNTRDFFRCVDNDLWEVNARGDISANLLDNMLCIEKENNPSEGEFFKEPFSSTGGIPTTDDFDQARRSVLYTFQPTASASGACQDSSGAYKADDLVRGARLVGGSLTQVNSLMFPLPTAGLSSACSERNAPLFLRNVTDNECTLTTTALDTECSTKFSGQQFVSNLYAGRLCNSLLGTSSQWVPVVLETLKERSPVTGVDVAVSAGAGMPVPTYSASTSSCSNALLELEYTFSYSEFGEIISVAAHAVVGVVNASTARAGKFAAVTQSFKATFNSTGARPKGGNPGYVRGRNVVAGYRTVDPSGTGKVAISQLVNGFQFLGHSAAGACSLSGPNFHTVTFDEDSVSTCTLALTEAQLQQFCTGKSVRQFLDVNVTDLYVGKWGNADYHIEPDWVRVTVTDITESSTYTSSSRLCTDIVNTLNIEFLTVDLGSVNNPQRKILAARVIYKSGNWQFVQNDTSTAQNFPVTITTHFVNIAPDEFKEVLPATPPVFPRVPRDVLYPLFIDETNSAPSAGASPILALCLLAVAVYAPLAGL